MARVLAVSALILAACLLLALIIGTHPGAP
jgi:hypothetical protein